MLSKKTKILTQFNMPVKHWTQQGPRRSATRSRRVLPCARRGKQLSAAAGFRPKTPADIGLNGTVIRKNRSVNGPEAEFVFFFTKFPRRTQSLLILAFRANLADAFSAFPTAPWLGRAGREYAPRRAPEPGVRIDPLVHGVARPIGVGFA